MQYVNQSLFAFRFPCPFGGGINKESRLNIAMKGLQLSPWNR